MTRSVAAPALIALMVGMSAFGGGTPATQSGSAGQTRTYYIAADEVTWDYVAMGIDGITGQPFKAIGFFKGGPEPDAAPVAKPVRTSYVKTLYREYTDNTFRTLKPRPTEWGHLGFLGPMRRGGRHHSGRVPQ